MKKFPLTAFIIGLNIIIFIFETIAGGSTNNIFIFATSTNNKVAYNFGALYTPTLPIQFWRLITSVFLHFGPTHLIMNMYALFNIGPTIEHLFGKRKFLLIYLLSGYSGNLMVWLVESITQDYSLNAGASGAIFGLLGALLVLSSSKYSNLKSIINKNSIVSSIGISLIISFLPGISLSAHLGGLMGGILITYALIKR